ncbi:MAG: hypothetical protein ABFS43_00040 [Thermodesulfobacteriota bacterium]
MPSLIERISRTEYIRSAIAEKADLSAFKARPTLRIKLGIALVFISYVIAWPAIAVLGYISVSIDKAWILAVGGPLLYGFSHLVFMLGMYLAGANYVKILLRWAARVFVEKRMHSHPDES